MDEYRLRLNYRYRVTKEIEVFYVGHRREAYRMSQALKIHHDLSDVVLKPSSKVNQARLKKMIRATLDQYLEETGYRPRRFTMKPNTKQRHGEDYRTPGYYLRLYRQCAELADKIGLRQHHLSETEHNKHVIGKANAKKPAAIQDCDYLRISRSDMK